MVTKATSLTKDSTAMAKTMPGLWADVSTWRAPNKTLKIPMSKAIINTEISA